MKIIDVFQTLENYNLHSTKFINPTFVNEAVEEWEKHLQLGYKGKWKYQPNILFIESNVGFDSSLKKRNAKAIQAIEKILQLNPFHRIFQLETFQHSSISNMVEREFSESDFENEGAISIVENLKNGVKWTEYFKEPEYFPHLKLTQENGENLVDIEQFLFDLDLLKEPYHLDISHFYEFCVKNSLCSLKDIKGDRNIQMWLFYSFLLKMRKEFQKISKDVIILCPYLRSVNYALKMKLSELLKKFDF